MDNNIAYQLISAFADPENHIFGNPAAVVLLSQPPVESVCKRIAADLNQPATTFLWPTPQPETFGVRWFAPDAEIDLCGHGSLAALCFLHSHYPTRSGFTLQYKVGEITGYVRKNLYTISLQAITAKEEQPAPPLLQKALGITVKSYYPTKNKHLVIAETADAVKHMKPDFALLRKLPIFSYAITAAGYGPYDFVSRTLVPHVGQLEDFATGSSHASLFPFWGKRFGKSRLTAYQASSRGGKFMGKLSGDKVELTGSCYRIASGKIHLQGY